MHISNSCTCANHALFGLEANSHQEGPSRPQRRPRSDDPPVTQGESPARLQALEDHVRQLEARLCAIEVRGDLVGLSLALPPTISSESSPGRRSIASYPSAPSSQGVMTTTPPLPSSTFGTTEISETVDADHARSLWHAYLTNIDPFLKLVNHEIVEDELLTYPQCSAQGRALLLSIFFAIRTSRPSVPLAEYLSSSKALESALQTANVLSHPNVTTLSAMTIYLTCGRVNMKQDYLRTMLSLLVRLATKLHLDREPETLGYLPSECEQRRRLWWHIVALDVRTAEASGTDPLIAQDQIEAQLPSMVSDSALRSQTFFQSSHHTPCIFYTVVAIEMALVAKKVLFPGVSSSDRASRMTLCDQLHRELVDKYMSRCKCMDSPVCRLTMAWCKIYWDRLRLLLRHWDKVFLKRVMDEDTTDDDETLRSCTCILNSIQQLRTDEVYSRWAWLWQNCTEWDACAIALCTIATGRCSLEEIRLAWIAIDTFFAAWTANFGDPAHQKRWRELKTFRDWVRATQSPSSEFTRGSTNHVVQE